MEVGAWRSRNCQSDGSWGVAIAQAPKCWKLGCGDRVIVKVLEVGEWRSLCSKIIINCNQAQILSIPSLGLKPILIFVDEDSPLVIQF
jgi:hypothetical protein